MDRVHAAISVGGCGVQGAAAVHSQDGCAGYVDQILVAVYILSIPPAVAAVGAAEGAAHWYPWHTCSRIVKGRQ